MSISDEIKDRLDLVDEISPTVTLKRAGKNYIGFCPFHPNTKTPSFVVFPRTKTWRCFGACNEGGSIFEFVMKREGWEFKEALHYLAEKAGIELRPLSREEQYQQELIREKETILSAAASFFQSSLTPDAYLPIAKTENPGLYYLLYQRGWSLDTIRESGVGYFGEDWNGLREHLKAAGINLDAPAAVALCGKKFASNEEMAAWCERNKVPFDAKDLGEPKFSAIWPNMIVYPYQKRGRVEYLSGRMLAEKRHWYPNSDLVGGKKVFYNSSWWIKDARYYCLVEGQGDAVTLDEWNLPAAALGGINLADDSSSDNHLLSALTQKAETGYICIGLDNDDSGRKAAAEVAAALVKKGIKATRIRMIAWPEKDANAWLTASAAGMVTEETALQLFHVSISWLDELTALARPAQGESLDDDRVRAVFAAMVNLDPFEIEQVRDDVCAALQLRRRAFDNLLKAARNDAGLDAAGQPKYFIEGGRIFFRYVDQMGNETVDALCNFTAEIFADVLRDNGQDVIREFHLRGKIGKTKLPDARVKAEDFTKMDWSLGAWGSRAIIEAGAKRRDQLRAAIQHLSPNVERVVIYTHTGWRVLENNQRVFLSATGAVNAGDMARHVNVDIEPELSLYELPLEPEDLTDAMKQSLKFLEVAPGTVTWPLWAAVYAAPLRELGINLGFTEWVYGGSGAMKTTICALALNHYGPRFNDKLVPASFMDTANRVEQKAFIAKDVLFLLDDYAPQKDVTSANEYKKTAHRIVRGVGNQVGRGRLSSDATARSTYVPRCLLMITGEDVPATESFASRLFVVEVKRGDVDKNRLTAMQDQRGRLSHAFAGYATWLARNWEKLKATAPEDWQRYRQDAFAPELHLRIPEAVAGLMMGIDYGLRFADEVKAVDKKTLARLKEEGWTALMSVAQAMSSRVSDEKADQLFLRSLSDWIVQGKIYLKPKTIGEQLLGGAEDRAEMLGWYDADRLYLLPEATINRLKKYYRDQGEMFPVNENTLRKNLDEGGWIDVEVDEQGNRRRTRVVNLDGQSRRVLVLKRSAIEKKEA